MSKRVFAVYSILLILVTASVTFLALISFNIIDGNLIEETLGGETPAIVRERGKTSELRSSQLDEAIDVLEDYYYEDIDQEMLTKGAIAGAVASLGDPWTTFMTKEDYEWFNSTITGEFSGVGISVSGDEEDNRVTVVAPIEGTPASRAGIKTGDKILRVDDVEVWGDKLDEAVARMKGLEGSDVKLTVLKANDGSTVDITITRAVINIESVQSNMYDDIGYIRIISFDERTAEDFETELDKMKQNKVAGLIIDLRENPGGLVGTCADIADTLLPPDSLIVYMEDKNGGREDLYAEGEYYDVPLVVLIDEGSASASEILAGALRDHNRAQLVGQKTFGKGLVQTLYELPSSKDYIKVTIARYFTPNGEDINELGIMPEHVIENPRDVEITDENDEQLKKALELLR